MDKLITSIITNNKAYKNLYKITSEIGHRMAGTRNEQLITDFMQDSFKASELETSIHTFEYEGWKHGESEVFWLNNNNRKFNSYPLGWTPNVPVEGEIIDMGYGYQSDYEKKKAKGKIVLINAGSPPNVKAIHRSEKYKLAIDNGAIGFLQYHPAPGGIIQVGSVSLDIEKGVIPALSISYESGQALLLADKRPVVYLKAHTNFDNIVSYNSIGYKKGSDKTKEEIIICGHQDCWFNSEGAYDNGSGIAMVMELAKHLSSRPTKRNIRFIGFGSEEIGLVGSKKYCESLSKQSKDSFDNIVAVFNLDVSAIKDGKHIISASTEKYRNFLAEIQHNYNLQVAISDQTGSHSDHYPFQQRDVPVSFFASSSNEWSYAHTDHDTIDKLTPSAFQIPILFIGICVYELANSNLSLR